MRMRAKMSRPRRCRERVDGHRGPGNVHHCSRYARPCAAVSLGLSHSPLGRCCCGCGEGVPPGKVRRRASTLRRFEAEAPTLARLLAKEHHGAQVAALQPRGALAAPAVGSNGGSALGHGQRPRPRSRAMGRRCCIPHGAARHTFLPSEERDWAGRNENRD